MKKKSFFVWVLPTLFSGILLTIGCHLSEKQTSLSDDAALISTRADDCDECDDECCCFIQLDGDDAASVLFCGTYDGAGATCSYMNCGGISGGGQLITLSVGTPRKLFCMEIGNSFYIRNWSTTDEVDVLISCQAEDGTPQTIMVHLEVWPMVGSEFFYSTNGECEVEDC